MFHRAGFLFVWLLIGTSIGLWPGHAAGASPNIRNRIAFSGSYRQAIELSAGQAVEISVGVELPSKLTPNGRIAVEWSGPAGDDGFRKVLHAIDPDIYVVYRAPHAGRYTLLLTAVENEESAATAPRWRETGVLAGEKSFPAITPWSAGQTVSLRAIVQPVDFGQPTRGVIVETEPNNSIAQAQPLLLPAGDDEQVLRVTGGA